MLDVQLLLHFSKFIFVLSLHIYLLQTLQCFQVFVFGHEAHYFVHILSLLLKVDYNFLFDSVSLNNNSV